MITKITLLLIYLVYTCLADAPTGTIERKQLTVTLTQGSEEKIIIPILFEDKQNVKLSTFVNQKTSADSSPCSLEVISQSMFHRYGELEHQWSTPIQQDFWQGGSIWDIIESNNRIVCVFENGEVSEFKSRGIDTTYKPLSKGTTSSPFNGKSIDYGNLLSYKQSDETYHILYFSQNGCYLINANSSWSKFQGYSGQTFDEAKLINSKIYVGARDVLTLYSVDIKHLKLIKEKQYSIYFKQDNQQFPIYINNFQYDHNNNRIYIIDQYEGIKYCELSTENKIEAKLLLPSERCENILMVGELLFLSCSHLVIANATSLKLLKQIRYPFHVVQIIYDEGYLSVFGDHQYAFFSILLNSTNAIQVEFLFRGKLPERIYEHYRYLPNSKYYLLISKQSLQFGRIVPNQYQLSCSFLKIADSYNFQSLQGQNKATLFLNGKCSKKDQLYQQCQQQITIIANIYNLKSYKIVFYIIIAVVLSLLLTIGGYKLNKLRKQRNSLKYKHLNEEQQSTNQSKADTIITGKGVSSSKIQTIQLTEQSNNDNEK